MTETTDRYQVRSTNFAPGPRHSIIDRELDVIIETFSTREKAEACLHATFKHLALSSLSARSVELVR